ncbi:MAG: HAMP domain-containing sensor histidine kinase [Saprospiraceae bacterium]
MDIQSQRSYWKIYLAIAGVAILLISLVYTTYLAQQLRQGERNKALLLLSAYKALDEADLNADVTLQLNIFESNKDIPIIVANESSEVQFGKNFGVEEDTNIVYLTEKLIRLKKKGPEPIRLTESANELLYYQNSRLHELLAFFPFVQLLLLIAFVSIGYISVNNARRAEQNRVWVGMAKETAHQLGTPISAIIGWIEHLRDNHYQNPAELDVLQEMQNDVARLDLIADRFSKIGSAPALSRVNIYDQMREITTYIRRRAPRKIIFKEPVESSEPLYVNINPPLFNWVIENIMRNALDALEEGTGKIEWEIHDKPDHIEIDISDTGKGIASSKLKTVFEPGYTTKTRGWGLGLSLAKRIIDNYHKGKIFVKHSKIGEGTTFAVQLPKQ